MNRRHSHLDGIDSPVDNLPAPATPADASQAQPPLNGIVPPVNNLPDSLKLADESQAQPSLDGIGSPVDNLPDPPNLQMNPRHSHPLMA